MGNKILLSFDVEEFDLPLQYGHNISEGEQMTVGYEGLQETMNLVEAAHIEVTFFTTANFASQYPAAIKAMSGKHEIASHTFYHSRFAPVDLLSSKALLENVTGKKVYGLRMPRMQAVKIKAVAEAGYAYDASVNPTWLPGRYNNWRLPRTVYKEENTIRLPASVTPLLRIPLFWLSFKNFPYSFYRQLVMNTLRKDGYLCLYFHPWELTSLDKYKVPGYLKKDADGRLQKKLRQLINDLKKEAEFISSYRYLSETYQSRLEVC